MGARVADALESRGYEVVRSSRGTGTDAYAGAGLVEAFTGASTVVDCTNIETISRRRAVDFFSTVARNVIDAVVGTGVRHIVCLSIVNASQPAVRKALGYYDGKGAQEVVYASSPVPVTIARSTAWFDLGEQFLRQVSVRQVSLVPRMPLRPVDPDAVAAWLVEIVEAGPQAALATQEIAGPRVMSSVRLARWIAERRHPDRRVVGVPMPSTVLRKGALLPGPSARLDRTRVVEWLDREERGGA